MILLFLNCFIVFIYVVDNEVVSHGHVDLLSYAMSYYNVYTIHTYSVYVFTFGPLDEQ